MMTRIRKAVQLGDLTGIETLVREGNPRLLPGTDGERVIALALPTGGAIAVRPHPRFPGTSKITGPVTRWGEEQSEEIVHPIELVDLLANGGGAWRRLRHGLAESVASGTIVKEIA